MKIITRPNRCQSAKALGKEARDNEGAFRGRRSRATSGPLTRNKLRFVQEKSNILASFLVTLSEHMRHTHGITGRGGTTYRPPRWKSAVLAALCVLLPAQVLAVDGAVYRSLVFPGAGQADQGHLTKAAVFAGAAVISGVGLLVSGVQYNQAVTRFRNEKRAFAALQDELNAGQVVSIDAFNARFASMNQAFATADSRVRWRNAFLISLASVYALNIVDVIRNDAHDPNVALRYSIDASRERVLLTRSFRF